VTGTHLRFIINPDLSVVPDMMIDLLLNLYTYYSQRRSECALSITFILHWIFPHIFKVSSVSYKTHQTEMSLFRSFYWHDVNGRATFSVPQYYHYPEDKTY